MTKRGRGSTSTAFAVGAPLLALAALAAPVGDAPAPLLPAPAGAEVLPGSYVVVLADDGAGTGSTGVAEVAGRAEAAGADVTAEYGHALDGFGMSASAAEVDEVRRLDGVAYVIPDIVVTADEVQSQPGWALDRIDQRGLPLDRVYRSATQGYGVRVYVIDSGLAPGHVELAGRVLPGAGFVNDGRGTTDCDGHGTAVSSLVAGATVGAAKLAAVVPVRVLDCQGAGSASGIISGLDWVTANAVRPAVANLSLGGAPFLPLDQAVQRSVAAGVTVTAAAGNAGVNACNTSPAREPVALTVGATAATDARASFSNTGTCLDLFAPGDLVPAAWPFDLLTGLPSTSTYVLISGTSFAAPLVAGAAALVLAGNPSLTPAQVSSTLVSNATTGVVTDPGAGSPNRLLFTAPPAPLVVLADPAADPLMTAVAQAVGGDILYVGTSGLPAGSTITTRRGVAGCTGLTPPATRDQLVAALAASVTGTASSVTGRPYGSTADRCISAVTVVQ